MASVAGGSSGTSSWGWAVTKACGLLRDRMEDGIPAEGLEVTADIAEELHQRISRSRFAYGAHFVEVRVDVDTAEVRLSRVLSVFAAGRIMNPRLARSQFIGGMAIGLSIGAHEG